MIDRGLEDAQYLERNQVYWVHLETTTRGHPRNLDVKDTEESVDIPERSEIWSQSNGKQISPSIGVEPFAKLWVRERLVKREEKDPQKLTLFYLRNIKSNLHDFLQEI